MKLQGMGQKRWQKKKKPMLMTSWRRRKLQSTCCWLGCLGVLPFRSLSLQPLVRVAASVRNRTRAQTRARARTRDLQFRPQYLRESSYDRKSVMRNENWLQGLHTYRPRRGSEMEHMTSNHWYKQFKGRVTEKGRYPIPLFVLLQL